ncbi:MAG: energy transducer TonB [Bacteroidia bacterium]|nr:energy transducer TonB [Bacteroidia bacterium]
MKKIVTVFSILAFSALLNLSFAQGNKTVNTPNADPAVSKAKAQDYIMINGERVYTKAEQMAVFSGGNDAMFAFIQNNLKYPAQAKTNKVEGKVYVSFTVGRDGTVKNVTLIKGIGSGCDEAAMHVINSMPKWTPGTLQGRPVAVQYTLPIQFSLSEVKQK